MAEANTQADETTVQAHERAEDSGPLAAEPDVEV